MWKGTSNLRQSTRSCRTKNAQRRIEQQEKVFWTFDLYESLSQMDTCSDPVRWTLLSLFKAFLTT